MLQLPVGKTVTYQLEYRKCGKASCKKCKQERGHGPYWYAKWREDGRVKSKYMGKTPPAGVEVQQERAETSAASAPHNEQQEEVLVTPC